MKQKTKTTIMKIKINQILFTALVAFFLIGGNVNAKGTELEATSSYENTEDMSLVLENWMTEDNFWTISESEFMDYETGLMIEEWMTEEFYWENNNFDLKQITDSELKIENWMINSENWK